MLSASLLGLPRTSVAHPGHAHAKSEKAQAETSNPQSPGRTWTNRQTSTMEHGTFVMASDGVVQIRRADDSLVKLPIKALSQSDQQYIAQRQTEIEATVNQPVLFAQAGEAYLTAMQRDTSPSIAQHFAPFVQSKAIRTRWDGNYFYVESNGMPTHPMMVGIRSWQQQVPLPQQYTGNNAWRIPLRPVPASTPLDTRRSPLRGAVALAVNGVPIFHPLNNRGDDAYLFGELDQYGGHCGRADDYHYHIAPVHLESEVGKDQPIAYALDGYPIYGYQDPKRDDFAPLDAINGHKDADGNYHYHATKTFPYLNGGFYGEVSIRGGQVEPQARSDPWRPALPPLRDAKITKFESLRPEGYRLTYDVRGKTGTVAYRLNDQGQVVFQFADPNGRTHTETYQQRQGGPGAPPPPRDDPPPRPDRAMQRGNQPPPRNSVGSRATSFRNDLEVKSDSVDQQGMLSRDCTCDGKRQSPAVAWGKVPEGTKAIAVSLWHTAPDMEKSYWVLYNIPGNLTGLAQGEKPKGTLGLNDRGRTAFDPMCSKGPGLKTYHITVFALSKPIDLHPSQATRENLLKAVKGITLAEGTLDVKYAR
ncbi:YHYH protein [Blastopirellula marina]|uniref:Phosphatidylethanolamine-binding protein n=2 Tax=Blastopirellula marina TaxID=124 RepID=A0A2S8FLS5_9BACT|nr:phosphatidylethanolamine-binding protein [Blastopirellula marina]PTL43306.1 YHYH protein [Blastopirellula marina]